MPGFNIQNFKAVVEEKGILRANKFLVRFNPNEAFMSDIDVPEHKKTNRELEFWCDSASIPGKMFTLRQLHRYSYGPVEKKPVNLIFNDITFTVIVDGKSAANLRFFHEWMFYIMTNVTLTGVEAYELSYKKFYMADMDIYVYNEAGLAGDFDPNGTDSNGAPISPKIEPVAKYKLVEAYPTHIADIPLNWADNQNVMRIPVTFTFHEWYQDYSRS